MGKAKRIAVLVISVGWIVPLTVAFAIGHSFAWLTYEIATGHGYAVPWHPFELMNALFYVAMFWLTCVIAGWSLWLTGKH